MEFSFTAAQASEHALIWCDQHSGWQRICDIENIDNLYKTWEELSQMTQKRWALRYPSCAKDAWEEYGSTPCKVACGYVTGKGEFYSDSLDVPTNHNMMTVYKVS